MRTTQYIGLNKFGHKLVEKALSSEVIQICEGICDELVWGRKYFFPLPPGLNKQYILTEEVQEMPWSSGPMIFTHLKATLVKESGQVLDMGTYCSWMLDPNLKEQETEFDYETGRYFV